MPDYWRRAHEIVTRKCYLPANEINDVMHLSKLLHFLTDARRILRLLKICTVYTPFSFFFWGSKPYRLIREFIRSNIWFLNKNGCWLTMTLIIVRFFPLTCFYLFSSGFHGLSVHWVTWRHGDNSIERLIDCRHSSQCPTRILRIVCPLKPTANYFCDHVYWLVRTQLWIYIRRFLAHVILVNQWF